MKTVWDIGTQRPHFAPLKEDRTVDLCVIGLGGSGLTAINEANARRLRVNGNPMKTSPIPLQNRVLNHVPSNGCGIWVVGSYYCI